MNLCDRCDRHYLAHEAACPFCTAPRRIFFGGMPRLGAALMAVITPAVLAACYGAPPDDTGGGPKDADGDGYDSDVDCDDENELVNPGVTEDDEVECADALDNDCDGLADVEDPTCT